MAVNKEEEEDNGPNFSKKKLMHAKSDTHTQKMCHEKCKCTSLPQMGWRCQTRRSHGSAGWKRAARPPARACVACQSLHGAARCWWARHASRLTAMGAGSTLCRSWAKSRQSQSQQRSRAGRCRPPTRTWCAGEVVVGRQVVEHCRWPRQRMLSWERKRSRGAAQEDAEMHGSRRVGWVESWCQRRRRMEEWEKNCWCQKVFFFFWIFPRKKFETVQC